MIKEQRLQLYILIHYFSQIRRLNTIVLFSITNRYIQIRIYIFR